MTHRRTLLTLFAGLIVVGLAGRPASAESSRPLLRLKAVPFTKVEVQDAFWTPRREVNRTVSLSHSLDQLESSGNVANFELAARGAREGYHGPVFMDSDLYKTLEAVSYSLATDSDPVLEKRLDAIIAKIAAAQMKDGYLNTAYQVNKPDRRWTNLRDDHELYCAGHLFEAAVAHYQATGKRTLLDVATRFADHIARRFGPGKQMGYPGHPEIELALVKLWRVTGNQTYFDLARFFVENRGTKFYAREHNIPLDRYDGNYWQDNTPIREHKAIVGHAVRAAYLFSGVVDVAGQTGDAGLLQMVDRVWRNTTTKNAYVTGGIGPSAHNEGFTNDYDLPNLSAYQETCASVAMVLWNHRLSLLYGDSRYADAMETALYNGALAGVSQDGKRFFYVNPLASRGNHHRSGWFGCACCPPNIARTLAALGGYAYATSDQDLWVNLYIQGKAQAQVGKRTVGMDVTTDYPWDGVVRLTVRPDRTTSFGLRLRAPGWCEGASVRVNGERQTPQVERGYMVLRREWKAGDTVDLDLPMPVRRVAAHPRVIEDTGRLAIARGPLVYCLEQVDHEAPINSIALPRETALRPERRADLLGGVVVLRGEGFMAGNPDWMGCLYRTADNGRRVPVTAVPYYAWDNREAGPMQVWMPEVAPVSAVNGPEGQAKVGISFRSGNSQPDGARDGVEPKKSGEQPDSLCHWWPHKGGVEWVDYTWDAPVSIDGSRVYWFDDTGRGECRLPAAWRLLYRDGESWKPVAATEYPVGADRWTDVRFAPVTTTALRLEVTMQPEWAAGVHEWQVLTTED